MKTHILLTLTLLCSSCSYDDERTDDVTIKTLNALSKYEGIVDTLSTPDEYCEIFNLTQQVPTYYQVKSTLNNYKEKKLMLIKAQMLIEDKDFDLYLREKNESFERIKNETASSLNKYRDLKRDSQECFDFVESIKTIDEPYFSYGKGSYYRHDDFVPNYSLLKKEEINLLSAAYIEQKISEPKKQR